MVSIKIDHRQMAQLRFVLKDSSKAVSREMAIVTKLVAKATVSQMAKTVAKEIKIKQKTIKESLKISQKGNKQKPKSIVTLKHEDRFPLRDFAARQTRKGVTYKLNPAGKRELIPSGFMWRNHVFKRVGEKVKMKKGRYQGKLRQRIIKLYGASAWGIFGGKSERFNTRARLREQVKDSKALLKRELSKRIKYLIHKAEGTLRGRQRT